jgi:hypothetical protein
MYICLMHDENEEYESWATYDKKDAAEKWVEEMYNEHPNAAYVIYWGEKKTLDLDVKVIAAIH